MAVGITGTVAAPASAVPAALRFAALPAQAASFTPPAGAVGSAAPESDPPATPWQPQPDTRLQPAPGSAGRAPAGTPVGAPGLGSLPYFSFEKVELTTNTVAQVNIANGNILITSSDGVLNGPGLALRSDRFYNGLSTLDGSFGGGWSSGLSQIDIGLKIASGVPTLYGPNGFRATFTASGSTYTPPPGLNATLTVGDGGNEAYLLTYNKTGERFTFNSAGWITSDKDRNGVGNTYTYNGSGQITQIVSAAGRTYTLTWASPTSSLISSITDSAGRAVTYARNAAGQLRRVDAPEGRWEEYDYNTDGLLVQARFVGTGTVASKVDFVYSGFGGNSRIAEIKIGTVGSSSYLSTNGFIYGSGQTTVIDPRGGQSVHTWDTSGRITSVKDQLNRTRSQTWTPNSDVQTSTDALASGSTPGNITTTTYDALNNATGTTLPTGAAASAQYATGTNCPGTGGTTFQPKCSRDAAGAGKKFDYDTAGNLLRVTDTTSGGTGAVPQQYTYQGTAGVTCGGRAGQVCSATDGRGITTSYTYDAAGNLTLVNAPAPQGDTSYAYDSLARVTSVTDPNGKTTGFTYNARDEIVTTTYAGVGTVTTAWFANGLRKSDTDSVAGTKTYSYDALGRLTNEVGPGSAGEAYEYDQAGNIRKYTDGAGLVGYQYNAAGQLAESIEPGGGCPPSMSTPPNADSGCIRYEYDGNGVEVRRVFPGGATVATTVDTSGRPTRITAKNGAATVVADIGYSYTAAGATGPAADRSSIQSRVSFAEPSIPAGAVTSYSYDSLNRLTAAVEKNGAATNASWGYSFDAAGNRTQQVRAGNTGAAAGTIGYTYNGSNWLTNTTADTTAWTYDAAGNQTKNGVTGQTAAYNARGAVTAVGSTTYT
ncbi:MAG: putative rhs related protein, partial [Actinomycetota bacterium]